MIQSSKVRPPFGPPVESAMASNHSCWGLPSVGPRHHGRHAALAGMTRWLATLAAVLAFGAESASAADLDSWAKVEGAPETGEYGQQIRDGKFEAAQRAFVEEALLPQLAIEANRNSIAAVRQRIPEIALRGATKDEIAEQVNKALRDGMLRLVGDEKVEPVVRINAMLLVGELESLDRTPWPGSLESVAKAAADANLPVEVRVVAMAGLAKQIAATGEKGRAVAAPVVSGLLTSPPKGDPAAVRWLLSRALEMLPAVAPSAEAIAAVTKILADEKADTDLRVRAAVALGKLATPEAGIDAAAAIKQVRTLAVAALSADLNAAEERRFFKKISSPEAMAAGMNPAVEGGFAPPPGRPMPLGGAGLFPGGEFSGGEGGGEDGLAEVIDEDAVPPLACRRDAWRLFVLAEAIRPARSEAGLAALLAEEPAAAAADLASVFRKSALELDANPNEESLKEALAEIKEMAGGGVPATAVPGGAGEPAPTDPASPLDTPSSASPF